jgi:chemotaxis protein MotA
MKKFDWTIGLGLIIGLAAIAGAGWLENLEAGFIWHPTAALVVGGGTFGAVIVRRGVHGISSALHAVWLLFAKPDSENSHRVILARLAWLSRSAHKNGLKTYEGHAEHIDDPLISRGLVLLAEGAPSDQMKEILTKRIDWEYEFGLRDVKTLEAAGTYAPTFGILGAVIGLISVLRVIDQTEALGAGIAGAFIATIYGIGIANLLFFPLASRLRERNELEISRREEIASVMVALGEKATPRAIINQFNLMQ